MDSRSCNHGRTTQTVARVLRKFALHCLPYAQCLRVQQALSRQLGRHNAHQTTCSTETAHLLHGLQHAALMAAGPGQDQTACRQRCVSHTHSAPALPVTARYAPSGDHASRCMTSRPAEEQVRSQALGHCTPAMMHDAWPGQSSDADSGKGGAGCKFKVTVGTADISPYLPTEAS